MALTVRRDVQSLLTELRLATVLSESDIDEIASDLFSNSSDDDHLHRPQAARQPQSQRQDAQHPAAVPKEHGGSAAPTKTVVSSLENEVSMLTQRVRALEADLREARHGHELAETENRVLRARISSLEPKAASVDSLLSKQAANEKELVHLRGEQGRLERELSAAREESRRGPAGLMLDALREDLGKEREAKRLVELDKQYLGREVERLQTLVRTTEKDRDEWNARYHSLLDKYEKQQQQPFGYGNGGNGSGSKPSLGEEQREKLEAELVSKIEKDVYGRVEKERERLETQVTQQTHILSSLRSQIESIGMERDAARRDAEALRSQMMVVEGDLRRLRGEHEAETSELRAVVRIKSFEAERSAAACDDLRKDVRAARRDAAVLREKLEAARDEYYRLWADSKIVAGNSSGGGKGESATRDSDASHTPSQEMLCRMLDEERSENLKLRRENLVLQADIARLLAHRETITRIKEHIRTRKTSSQVQETEDRKSSTADGDEGDNPEGSGSEDDHASEHSDGSIGDQKLRMHRGHEEKEQAQQSGGEDSGDNDDDEQQEEGELGAFMQSGMRKKQSSAKKNSSSSNMPMKRMDATPVREPSRTASYDQTSEASFMPAIVLHKSDQRY
eukprot:ANDGO_07536.mRNA.1 hypothetical protein